MAGLEGVVTKHVLDIEGRGLNKDSLATNKAILAGELAGVFSPVSGLDHVERVPPELRNADLEKSWQDFYDEKRVADKKNLHDADDANPSSDPLSFTEEDIELLRLNSTGGCLRAMPSDIVRLVCMFPLALQTEQRDLVQYFENTFTLNKEQAMAFRLVAMHSLQPKSASTPLRLIIHGPGGTGKSRVIDALRSFFECRNESRRLRLAAYTGVAAKNINGVTMHNALELQQNMGASTRKKNLLASWTGVDYLIIDEMSMVGLRMMHSVDNGLQIGKAVDSDMILDGALESFGNVSLMFAGDFCQLKPVGDMPLFTPESALHADINASSTEMGQKKVKGKKLWSTFEQAVVLHQAMRQSGEANEGFRQLLHRARFGNGSRSDVKALEDRRLEKLGIEWASSEWHDTPALFGDNSTKDTWNVRCVQRYAAEQSCEITWYTARDTLDKKLVNSAILKQVLRGLNTGKTKFLMGALPLVEGMRVIIGKNYDVGGGVVNGSMGILRSVQYVDGLDGERHATNAVVYVPDSSEELMPGLRVHERVVFETEKEFIIKHPFSGRQVSIKRKQIPLEPAYALTVWKAQGRTLPNAIVDLESASDTASAYVMLSRVTSIHGLAILRSFNPLRIQTHAREEVRREVKRIEWLSLKTRQADSGTVEEKEQLQNEMDSLAQAMAGIGSEATNSRPTASKIQVKTVKRSAELDTTKRTRRKISKVGTSTR